MNLLSELKEGTGISWSAIRANKMRSVLTTLGIVIGIITVTLMGTAITGLNRAFLKNISVIGAAVLYVDRFDWFMHSHEEWMRAQKRRRITETHADALRDQLTLARAVAPVAEGWVPVRYKRRGSSSVHVIGTTDHFLTWSWATPFTTPPGDFLCQPSRHAWPPIRSVVLFSRPYLYFCG